MFNKKIGALSVALLMGLGLTACGSKEESEGTLLHLLDGEYTYTIIYDKDLSKNAVSACKELNEHLGGTLTLTDDVKEADCGQYEILLGETNRPESIAQAEG